MDYPEYTVWFRGFPACPCLAEWLPVFEAELLRRGVIKSNIDITQLIGSASKSANTHKTGGAFDIWHYDDTTVWVARQMGADATWARTTGSFANIKHTHGVLSGGAVARITGSKLKELVITDSIQPTSGVQAGHNVRVVSIADLIGEAISRTATEESVSSLFD